MPEETTIPFQLIIEDVYSSVFEDYGFELQGNPTRSGNGEYKISARNDNIELNFYLGSSPLFYYCDVDIKLLGELQKKAIQDIGKGGVSVITIAKHIDPEYTYSKKAAETKEDVIEKFVARKETLLKYCQGILSGDISDLVKVAQSLKKNKYLGNYLFS